MTWPTISPPSSATSDSSGTNPSEARIASIIRASRGFPKAASGTAAIAFRSAGVSGRISMRARLAPSGYSICAMNRSAAMDEAGRRRRLERLRERLARVPDDGWFFARIAGQVAEQRLARKLSQRELAELVGTTQSAIARLERGGRPPRIDTLLRIAEALDCELVVELSPHSD